MANSPGRWRHNTLKTSFHFSDPLCFICQVDFITPLLRDYGSSVFKVPSTPLALGKCQPVSSLVPGGFAVMAPSILALPCGATVSSSGWIGDDTSTRCWGPCSCPTPCGLGEKSPSSYTIRADNDSELPRMHLSWELQPHPAEQVIGSIIPSTRLEDLKLSGF